MKGMTNPERLWRRKKIAKYCEKHTIGEAAEKFGLSRTQVSAACKEFGTNTTTLRTKKESASNYKILLMLLQGERNCVISKHFGVKPQTVNHIRKRAQQAGFNFDPDDEETSMDEEEPAEFDPEDLTAEQRRDFYEKLSDPKYRVDCQPRLLSDDWDAPNKEPEEPTRIVCIKSGGDWSDASFDLLAVSKELDLQEAKQAWKQWIRDVYWPNLEARKPKNISLAKFPPDKIPYQSLPEFLINNDLARPATDEEVTEIDAD